MNPNPTPITSIIHFVGLNVHKESVHPSIAPSHSTEVRPYGPIGGSLDDLDRFVKKLQAATPGVELRFRCEAGPTGYPLCGICARKGSCARWSPPRSSPGNPGTA